MAALILVVLGSTEVDADVYEGDLGESANKDFCPGYISNYNPYGSANDVDVEGDYAYLVGSKNYGLAIIDISSPLNAELELTSSISVTSSDTENVAVSGDYAYVTAGDDGLFVFDVSNSTDPQWIGDYSTEGEARDVTVRKSLSYGNIENYAYLTDSRDGLIILDVSDPTNPQKVGSYENEGFARDLVVVGNYVYLTANDLVIIDVSDHTNPQLVGEFEIEGYPFGLDVNNNVAYVGTSEGAVAIDVSEPDNMRWIATITNSWVEEVFVSDNYLYVAEWLGEGMQVFNVTNPTEIQWVATLSTGFESTNAIFVNDAYAYLVLDDDGLRIYELDNTCPIAIIDSISHSIDVNGEKLTLKGYGTKEWSSISGLFFCDSLYARDCQWRISFEDGESSIDYSTKSDTSIEKTETCDWTDEQNTICGTSDFQVSLSLGYPGDEAIPIFGKDHIVYFRYQDHYGWWSQWESESVTVKEPDSEMKEDEERSLLFSTPLQISLLIGAIVLLAITRRQPQE